MPTNATHIALRDMLALEELFLDELSHKIDAVFDLYQLSDVSLREVRSFSEQLESLTKENIELLTSYGKKSLS